MKLQFILSILTSVCYIALHFITDMTRLPTSHWRDNSFSHPKFRYRDAEFLEGFSTHDFDYIQPEEIEEESKDYDEKRSSQPLVVSLVDLIRLSSIRKIPKR